MKLLLPDLVVVAPECLDGALELVGDVELVCVEEEEDAVDALGEPLEHADEVVAAVRPLLLAGQYAGRVHDGNPCKIKQKSVRIPKSMGMHINKSSQSRPLETIAFMTLL